MVCVLNKHGKPLMPCHPAKARILLKEKKATVVKRTPFTIQLLYGSSGYKQDITLGIDSGYSHIGLSAVSEKRELFSAEVALRTDIVRLLSERRAYRRNRRSRKTRYRKPRFLNRRKGEGWLPPSIQHKLDSHVKAVEFVAKLLPIVRIIVEVASFDIQELKNPDISGREYQEGDMLGFYNTREYVLYRDNHECQMCHGKSGDKILQVHHIVSRKTGGDRPDNLIILCTICHRKLHAGKVNVNLTPKSKGFKAETLMNIIRRKLLTTLRDKGLDVLATYGYETKRRRAELGVPKSHTTDAFVIAGGLVQDRSDVYYYIRQVRKCNRRLFRGIRSHIRNTAGRFVKGFQRFDKVKYKGIECFIYGRRKTGYFSLKKLDGSTIGNSVKYKKLKLLERFNTFLIERRLLPSVNEEVSGA